MTLSLSTLKSLLLNLWSKLFYFYKSDSFNLQLRNPLTLTFKYIPLPIGEIIQNDTEVQGQENAPPSATNSRAALKFV